MSKWIKCSERLPEGSDEVLVWETGSDESNVGYYYKDVPYLTDGWRVLDCNQAGYFFEQTEKVTHWMPKPTSPTEAE